MDGLRLEVGHRVNHLDPVADYINAGIRPGVEAQDEAVLAQLPVVLEDADSLLELFDAPADNEPDVEPVLRTPDIAYLTETGTEGAIYVAADARPPREVILFASAGDTEPVSVLRACRTALSVRTTAGERAGRQEDLNFLRGVMMRIRQSCDDKRKDDERVARAAIQLRTKLDTAATQPAAEG